MYGLGVVPSVLFNLIGLNPSLTAEPAEIALLTSMFLNRGWMHRIGNTLYIWIFGNGVEDATGVLVSLPVGFLARAF